MFRDERDLENNETRNLGIGNLLPPSPEEKIDSNANPGRHEGDGGPAAPAPRLP